MRKPVVGYPFDVDDKGQVYFSGTDRKKAITKRKGGYGFIEYHTTKRKRIAVHRLVWEAFNGEVPEGMEIDHIDRNPSNNNLSNLRTVSRSQNRANSKKRCDAKCSRFVGVIDRGGSLRGQGLGYRARVKKGGKPHYSRLFKCETAAAIARDKLALELFGDHASLNFPALFGRDQPSAAAST